MIRVGIVDDQLIVRQGLTGLLGLVPDVTVTLEAADGDEALRLLAGDACDVLLLDLRMPQRDGLEVLRLLNRREGRPHVLVLTTFDDGPAILQAIRLGARGVMLKDVSLAELGDAIRDVHAGRTVFQQSLTASLLENVMSSAAEPLNAREGEVVALMAHGFSNREIADALNLAEGTVKNYVSAILLKLDARDRTHAVVKLLRTRPTMA